MDGWSKKLTPLGYLFLYMGVEPKIGGKPQIIHFNKAFMGFMG